MARAFRVSLRTVQRWLERAADERLDRVVWTDRSRAPHRRYRTDAALEDRILSTRRSLRETSILGEYGAIAIRRELLARVELTVPSVRTIGRILERRGALDATHRVRRPAPPAGWYLPEVAARRTELDSFDTIEGLRMQGGLVLEILTGISLHGGLTAAWPEARLTAAHVSEALVAHWRAMGLPGYAQFDNAMIFHGSHGQPDVFGRVIRVCASLGIVPVFVPPREMGFQAAIESFNGRWQAKVWARVWSASLDDLRGRSDAYITASRARHAVRIEAAPERRPFPADWALDLHQPPVGLVVYLRRTSDAGTIRVLGHTFLVDPLWPHRLVRTEVDLDRQQVRFFALRRRDPTDQPLLGAVPYVRLPARPRR